ncbi:hypothetical protein D3C81_1241220 [compost metagenome]
MVAKPLVAAQRPQHFLRRHGAVLQANAGVLGLRAFLVGQVPHIAGKLGGDAAVLVQRGHVRAPPLAGAGQPGEIVAARVGDALAMAAGAEGGVQVDPAQAFAAAGMLTEHRAQGQVAPGRRVAAVEQAVRMRVLAAADRSLDRWLAVGVEIGVELVVGRRRWPAVRHQGAGELVVAGVFRQLREVAEVLEIAVQVDVLVGPAPPPGEAPGVDGMEVEQRDAGRFRLAMELRIGEQGELHA